MPGAGGAFYKQGVYRYRVGIIQGVVNMKPGLWFFFPVYYLGDFKWKYGLGYICHPLWRLRRTCFKGAYGQHTEEQANENSFHRLECLNRK